MRKRQTTGWWSATNKIMKRLSFIAAALLCFVTVVSAAIRPAQPGIGGGGSTVSGSITGAYSFNGGLSTINATNVYLAPAISNLVLNPVLGYGTNYLSLLSAYTNVIYVNASNTAINAGMNLTNISTKAAAGSLIIVGPGRYFIPTNQQSIAGRGVDMYFHPGAIVTAGDSGDTATDNALFEDALAGTGATTNRIMGYGEFYTSNTLGRVILVSEGASDLTFECKLAWALGSNPVIDQSAGSLNYTAHDFTRGELYDVFTGGTAAPKKTMFRSASAYAGDSIVELNAAYTNWGDGVFIIGYAEALAGAGTYGSATLAIADNSIMDIQVLNFKRSKAAITGLSTNKNSTGNGILRNCTVYALPASTFSPVTRYDANNGTEFRLLNCTIYGPTGVDPIDYTTAFGKFTLENTRVIAGASATNAIRAGATGSRMELVGVNSLNAPRHANITTVASTNYVTSIKSLGRVSIDGELNVGGNSAFTNAVDFFADMIVQSPGTFQTSIGALSDFGGGVNFSSLTPSRPLILNSSGDVTNAVGTPDGTKFLRDDGTLAVPTNFITTAHGSAYVTNSVTASSFIGSGTGTPILKLQTMMSADNAFAITVATNRTATTTNIFDFTSVAVGDDVRAHTSSAGQIVWTNASSKILTNLVGMSFDYGLLYAATNTVAGTNIAINFSPNNTNHLDIYTTNWWCQWTNISGLAQGSLANKTIRITPSAPGQNLTNVWPVGKQHGIYQWNTNANSPIWTVLTNAKTYVLSLTAYGTNIHASMSLWEP